MKLYKLTDQNSMTQTGRMGETKWEIGITIKTHPKKDPKLCSSDVIHAYTNHNLAYLLNPIHANISNPLIYVCEGVPCVSDWGKCGCFELTPIKLLKPPKWINSKKTTDVQIMFAILCAEAVLYIYEVKNPNDNRPRRAIEAAREYLKSKSAIAVAEATEAATNAAVIIDAVAKAAAWAAWTAEAANVIINATWTWTTWTTWTADAAAEAADAAAKAAEAITKIDFGKLADKAVKEIINE